MNDIKEKLQMTLIHIDVILSWYCIFKSILLTRKNVSPFKLSLQYLHVVKRKINNNKKKYKPWFVLEWNILELEKNVGL